MRLLHEDNDVITLSQRTETIIKIIFKTMFITDKLKKTKHQQSTKRIMRNYQRKARDRKITIDRVMVIVVATDPSPINSLHTGLFFMFFGRLLIFIKITIFEKILSGIPSECQTVWDLDCQGYKQTTLVDNELKSYWY